MFPISKDSAIFTKPMGRGRVRSGGGLPALLLLERKIAGFLLSVVCALRNFQGEIMQENMISSPIISGWKSLEPLPWVWDTVNSKADCLVQRSCLWTWRSLIGIDKVDITFAVLPVWMCWRWSVVGGSGWCLRGRQRKPCTSVSFYLSSSGQV